jgi:hypothetical protein
LADNHGVTGAALARELDVARQTFAKRARKWGFPRLPDGRYDRLAALEWWTRTTSGSRHGGRRRNGGATPSGASPTPSPAPMHPEDVAIEALINELWSGFFRAPWPGVFPEKAPGRRYEFTVAEARCALAELPLAREWAHCCWLTGGSWTPLDDEVAADEGECRRELLREALRWAVALHRATSA